MPVLPIGTGKALTIERLSNRFSGLRVLLVDDDDDTRQSIAEALAMVGALVEQASSTDEALHQLEHHRFDLLIADIGMPAEDGYSLIRRVRALPAASGGTIQAVALTGYARPEDA